MNFQTLFGLVFTFLWIDFFLMAALGGFTKLFHREKGDYSVNVRTHISNA